jgi:hypothetical protein
VVGGENIFAPEARVEMLMMAVIAVLTMVAMAMTVIGLTIRWKLADRIVHKSLKK